MWPVTHREPEHAASASAVLRRATQVRCPSACGTVWLRPQAAGSLFTQPRTPPATADITLFTPDTSPVSLLMMFMATKAPGASAQPYSPLCDAGFTAHTREGVHLQRRVCLTQGSRLAHSQTSACPSPITGAATLTAPYAATRKRKRCLPHQAAVTRAVTQPRAALLNGAFMKFISQTTAAPSRWADVCICACA